MKYAKEAMRLREATANADMTAQELANRAGIHKSSISHYYNGSNRMGNIAAGKIGKVLGVSPLWLMDIDFAIDALTDEDSTFIEKYKSSSYKIRKRMIRYMEMLEKEMEEENS